MSLRGAGREAGAWPAIMEAWGHLIPPYPGPDVVPLARVPPPPLLDAESSLELRAWECAVAYRSVVTSMYGRCNAMPVMPRRSWEAPASVMRGAKILTELRRPPMGWCAFSVRNWLTYHAQHAKTKKKRAQQPPIAWVFAATRLQAQEEWYAWERSRLLTGRVLIPQAHSELIMRYESLRRELLELDCPAQAEVEATIERVLSRRKYDRLVRLARKQSQDRSEDLEDRIQRGEYIW